LAKNIKSGGIEETSDFGSPLKKRIIPGMAETAGLVKILWDIDRIPGAAGAEGLKKTAWVKK
jgi:hypothetical protein